MTRSFFDPVDPKPDFPKLERKLLAEWEKKGVVEKYLHKNDKSPKRFSFLDGPITANNPMGVHHAWGRTYKDLWQRYKNMQGYAQRFQNGFDCQGLWVEVEVEKQLGLKSKKEIENLVPGDRKASIAKFVELCKERVRKYSAIQTEQSRRLGYFMDWDNSYFTMSDANNYAIWNFLKKCHGQDLIYKGRDVVPWCPRCETAISQHEMLTEDYKETTHEALFVEYRVKEKKNTYLLVWTTTPWTLPGNVAVAVDPKADYVEASGNVSGNVYVLLKEAAKRLNLKIKRTFKGSELVGLTYTSPFDNLPGIKKSLVGYTHRVVATDDLILPVSETEGTGLVHMATGQGAEDYQLGKKNKLPVIELIDETATYLEGLENLTGQSAKKHPEIIIEFVKNSDFLFDTQKYTHRYPACWRCKTELVWKLTDEWYIAIDPVREEMIRIAKKIKWFPEFGLERELDWLTNMHDWLISKKNRYWGLALPIWECPECGNFEVIGSKEELQEKARGLPAGRQGWEKFAGHTPHKPWVDEVKIKCLKCGRPCARIADVGNPWLDAGIVGVSTLPRDWFPADFITESFPGQFKNWFYSLIAMSTVLADKEPTKAILGFATLLDEKGKPMHKSTGNMIEFLDGAEKVGVDVMRWLFVRQNPAENLLFGYQAADEARRRFHLKLWNVYNFFITYANLDGWRPIKYQISNIKHQNILDEWILARLNETVKVATKSLDNYDAFTASASIDKFVDDVSLWYIRRSRDRVGPAAESQEDKKEFYRTCHLSLVTLCKLLAPFTPFLAEEIYRNLTKEESVHLTAWPGGNSKFQIPNSKLIEEMQKVRELVEKIHAARKQAKVPVKVPLKSYSCSLAPLGPELEELIKEEANLKSISWGVKADRLDTKIYTELEEEAKVRELVRKIQEQRKQMGLSLTQKVTVTNPWLPEDRKLREWLLKKAQVNKLSEGEFNVQRTQG